MRHIGLLLAFILCLCGKDVFAQEEIQNFDVHATVEKDGRVDILEQITVNAEHVQINHGIYREIPVVYTYHGQKSAIGFSIKDIKRDGLKEPYHVKNMDNGPRIYIGDKNSYVPMGVHTYSIEYEVFNVIGFFPDHDEFYWNVTGNGWTFPIEKAHITVNLPTDAHVLATAGYTGTQGSREKNFYSAFHDNIFETTTTAPLRSYEGLTVAVSFPQHIVKPPTAWMEFSTYYEANKEFVTFALTAFFVLLAYGLMWFFAGRDRVLRPIIPRFDIPDNLSPDLLRYVIHQKYDDKTLACFLVEAAVNKQIKITEDEDDISIEKLSFTHELTGLSGQDQVFDELFREGGTLKLPRKKLFSFGSHWTETERKFLADKMLQVKSVHMSALFGNRNGLPFSTNQSELRFRVLGGVANYLLQLTPLAPGQKYFTLSRKIELIRVVIAAAAIVINIASYPNDPDSWKLAAFAFAALYFIFIQPMKKFSERGQELFEYGKGLKLYLTVAEEARMNKLYPKNITPDIFEKFLPYALALDVEQDWCKHFAAYIESAGIQYQSTWYYGNYNSLSSFGSDIGSSFTSSISSASTPPGSSSGSSGGSGGGGGGGGGGGW